MGSKIVTLVCNGCCSESARDSDDDDDAVEGSTSAMRLELRACDLDAFSPVSDAVSSVSLLHVRSTSLEGADSGSFLFQLADSLLWLAEAFKSMHV